MAALDWDNLRVFLELTRSQGLVDAAKKLGVDHSTVSRRMRRFEEQVGSQLFERNNQGYTLTAEGHRLIEYAEQVESTVYAAAEELSGHNRLLSGQVRLGATEGFGTFVLAPHLAHFCARHPHISVDLLPVPRFVNLSKREADIGVTLERPQSGNYVMTKLTDYVLKVYATPAYLANHPTIRTTDDLVSHPFIGYVDDLVFSEELRYKENVAPSAFRAFRSTSVIAQYTAACRGQGLAILPCFLAQQSNDLVPVLDGQVDIQRTFWLVAAAETRNVARVAALWSYLRDVMEPNRAYLMGESRDMVWLE
ncbi:LysR family transcriptional regulator [Glaciimonas sp. CA11.2]|uniref:LysR family transcriptional regulator n=1 Tax=unclassified Glaciimonas TaxID=2644401 RepID=UPI002AB4A9F2|nr:MULTISPECIES: LysR family transcriptional regulator [unclassified Glaciimonas]MDY7544823.1 LysR family transcriptional regulator [Glaciimonas sp. CA11.2]MEB0014315.1 LysR family transcriptional regulator [Glaciimonas sp. Cout2]MEB0084114.1 LysR family transcriptional regulator [Glaciimonas sp. Gout2]MEB0163898.1 LysR family transcriptional regulator [Glaciimonas sp. CA11.2]